MDRSARGAASATRWSASASDSRPSTRKTGVCGAAEMTASFMSAGDALRQDRRPVYTGHSSVQEKYPCTEDTVCTCGPDPPTESVHVRAGDNEQRGRAQVQRKSQCCSFLVRVFSGSQERSTAIRRLREPHAVESTSVEFHGGE